MGVCGRWKRVGKPPGFQLELLGGWLERAGEGSFALMKTGLLSAEKNDPLVFAGQWSVLIFD